MDLFVFRRFYEIIDEESVNREEEKDKEIFVENGNKKY